MSRQWDKHRFDEIDALLQQALDLDASARRVFLARLDDETAQRLAALLAAADTTSDALAATLDARVWAALADDPATGQRFGAWRALGTLAHGGMARVLLAERADGAFQQHAAIKSLWPGLATTELVARFEQERQILARLDDPRIARLLDGGVRDDGVPWLALEYVDGQPIGTHCDAHQLDLDARLALWLDVAAAVAAAHRQLIVHRDLKPANVMVSRAGAVKLLDFGIAKLLDAERFPHAAPPTQFEGRALTREYASPEQLRHEPVTTASDVYQLGLLLYELLSGVQPFRAGSDAQRERRADELPAPSNAVLRDGDASANAARRATNPTRLARRMRGDLDAIVLRALAAMPAGRYGSVDALCDDVQRWQRGLPVRARRASRWHRAGKWLRRHALLAGASTVIALIGGAYTITALLQARAIAHEAGINRAVRDYLVGWLQAADPGGTGGRDPRASEMLEAGLARARHDLVAQPELEAEILGIVGEVYIARGEYARAEPVLRDAHALYRDLPQLDPAHRGASTASLATLMHFSGRYAEAETLFREALEERIAAIGERAYWSLITREYLADLLHTRGRYAEARAEFERSLAGALATIGESDPLTATMQRYLGDVARDSGRFDEADAMYARALATQLPAHGERHPNTAGTRLSRGRLRLEQGRYAEAAAEIEPTFATYRQMAGEKTPATAYWERVLAELEEARGEFATARARLQRIEESIRPQLPPGHVIFGYIALDAAYVELALGHVYEARQQFANALRVFDEIQPQGHPRRIEVRIGEALLARYAGDEARSNALLDQAFDEAHAALTSEHPLFAAIADARAGASAQTRPGLAGLRVQRAIALVAAAPRGVQEAR
jgi:serine/threonine-protein kinase